MSFESDVKNFNKDALGGLEKSIRATFIAAFISVMNKTPVDTGRARSNWFSSIGKVSTASGTGRRNRAKRMREMQAVAKRFKLGSDISFVNNLPYIVALEDGHSRQARGGMVKVTFSRLERVLLNKIKALR